MKDTWKRSPYFRGGVMLFTVAVAVYLFYKIIDDFSGVSALISTISGILMPFTVGAVLAYLLSPLYNRVEAWSSKVLRGKSETESHRVHIVSKVIATIVCMVFLLAVVVGLISLVIPQAYASIVNLINTFPEKQAGMEAWILGVGDKIGGGEKLMSTLLDGLRWVTVGVSKWAQESLLPNLGDIAMQGTTIVISIIDSVISVVVGVIICVYVLNSKRLFAAQAKKVTYSLFKTSTANYLIHMTRYIDQTFGRFINGMLVDALVVGVLCFIGMSILQMPYALLVSTIVGAFNVVPVFGPIVAAVTGAFFVMLDNPFKALIFLVFVLVLQQIDGNIVAPRILGNQTGLRGFWVIFAIVVGGGMFGFIGMLLGVPTFAVIYALFQQKVVSRLRKKNFAAETEAYDGLWEIDEHSGEMKYDNPKSEVNIPVKPKKNKHKHGNKQENAE